MGSQSEGASTAFRDLADVLETLETTETDVEFTYAKPVDDDLLTAETVGIELGVQVPLLNNFDKDTEAGVDLTPETVRLQDDGSLHVGFAATVGRDHTPSEECNPPGGTSEDKPEDDSTTESESNVSLQTEETAAPVEEERGDFRPKRNATTEMATAETRHKQSPPSDSDTETTLSDSDIETTDRESQNGDVADHEPVQQVASDSESAPEYQDPERLAAVYDKYDTFAEMRDALEVDVTSQTVRRYMIEHGIHEPASTTGSRSAEVLLNADPDSFPIGMEREDSTSDDESMADSRANDVERDPTETDENRDSLPTTDTSP
jgi:hypothetical protein